MAICVPLSCTNQTSKRFRDIIEGSAVLQYNLERGASLLTIVPNDGDNLPVAVKLARLRRREAGWANLEWQPKIYKVPRFIPSAMYELQQGFYAQGLRSNPASRYPDSLLLQPLPRMVGDPLLAQVDASTKPIFNPLGFVFRDFNFDPEQNLAVYVCRTHDGGIGIRPSFRVFIRIRQLSDNTPHPLAAYEVLNSNLVTRSRCAYYIQIFGDFIGVLAITSPREDCFWIWNWKTGILQCVSAYDSVVPFSIIFEPSISRCQEVEWTHSSFYPRDTLPLFDIARKLRCLHMRSDLAITKALLPNLAFPQYTSRHFYYLK